MDYKLLIKQTESIIQPDIPLVSNLANVAAILNQLEDINWCGFYLVKYGKLYLGPFQGEVACTVIEHGKAWNGHAVQTFLRRRQDRASEIRHRYIPVRF